MGLRQSRVVPPLAVAVLVAAMALIPALRDHRFYLTDDSAAQFLPSWYHLGELLRSGQFPLLDPTLWAGGNIAAEALFGIWNPVLLATMVFVSLVPNLVVASVVVKTFFLVLLALGVYGLAREYDVPPGFAAVAAVTVPFAGVTLYFDAAVLVVRAHGLRVRALVLVDAAALRPRRAHPARPVRRRLPRDDRGQPVRRARRVPGGGRSGRRVRVEQAMGAGAPDAAGRDRRRPRRAADLPAAGAHPVRHVPERLEDRQQRAHGARAGRPAQRLHAQLRRVGGRLRAPVPDRPGDLPGLVRAPAAALAALPRDRRRARRRGWPCPCTR